MNKLTNRLVILLVAIAAQSWGAALAGEPPADEADKPEPSASALEQASAIARRFEIRLADQAESGNLVPPIERPLLLFGDDSRNHTRGILWGWGTGRPVAVAELWRGRAEDSPFAVSVTLAGADLLAMRSDGRLKWQPVETQVAFAPLPAAPPPAAKEVARLRQIKEISRRFTAHEFWDPENSRFELRLLVQPVHRYRDEAAEILDGALFVLAHGTNPEALLLIEAIGPTVEKSRWQYGLVRTTNAELHAELDEKEVWMQPRTKGSSTKPAHPYFVFSLPSASASAPAQELKKP